VKDDDAFKELVGARESNSVDLVAATIVALYKSGEIRNILTEFRK
jgi:hypothetical protein